jgi:hypothetical protein
MARPDGTGASLRHRSGRTFLRGAPVSHDKKLFAASKAAEGWLNTVSYLAQSGEWGRDARHAAVGFLPIGPGNNLFDSYKKNVEALERAKDAFVGVSDGVVKWNGGPRAVARNPSSLYPYVWTSAHEAAVGIAREALERLAFPLLRLPLAERLDEFGRLLAAEWKALALSSDEVAELQARIRRERVKLLGTGAKTQQEHAQRLSVDLNRSEIVLYGKPYPCTSRQALIMLAVYAEQPGEWITQRNLRKRQPELDGLTQDEKKDVLIGAKVRELTKYLPATIRVLLEKGEGNLGTRLVLPKKRTTPTRRSKGRVRAV